MHVTVVYVGADRSRAGVRRWAANPGTQKSGVGWETENKNVCRDPGG
jgi:hypothetical protein